MFPKGTPDPEYPNDSAQSGTRLDNRNLVQEWLSKHQVMRGCSEGTKAGPRAGLCLSGLCAKTGCVPAGNPVCLESHGAHAGIPGLNSDSPHG